MINLLRSALRRLGPAAVFAAVVTIAATAAHGAGVLRVASMGEPASLDPHKVSGTWENYIVGDMYVGLTT
ncbi:MAG: hypothetical protein LJE64_14140, partial [Desulfofustis sp.]|nr:hypothetical protein [Desulfofustis sp.]